MSKHLTYSEYMRHLNNFNIHTWSDFNEYNIRKYYRAMGRIHHPDKNKGYDDGFMTSIINPSYDVLYSHGNFSQAKQVIDEHINDAVKGHLLPGFDFHGADSHTQGILGDAVFIFEGLGWDFS